MNCHTFSTGLSSGHLGGSAIMVMLAGTTRRVDMCQPAWSTSRHLSPNGRGFRTSDLVRLFARAQALPSRAGPLRAAPRRDVLQHALEAGALGHRISTGHRRVVFFADDFITGRLAERRDRRALALVRILVSADVARRRCSQ